MKLKTKNNRENQWSKNQLFEKVDKIDTSLLTDQRKKEGEGEITNIRNVTGAINHRAGSCSQHKAKRMLWTTVHMT